jgi:hypothetical protein
MRSSEALDTDSDDFDPELLPVDFDDEAICTRASASAASERWTRDSGITDVCQY